MRLLWIAAAIISLSACASKTGFVSHLAALEGDKFAIDGRAVRQRYHIHIRYPEGYGEQSGRRYPIVYLLDGDSLFPHLAPMQRFLAHDDDLTDTLVVGIAYGSFDPPQNQRRRDFTDGAPAFAQFLEGELIPAVERRVRAQPDRRILFGQSRGGGFVLYSAFTNPDLFWGRIASNPTLDLLAALNQTPAVATRSGLRLLVTSGSLDQPEYRQPALQWFAKWQRRPHLPWTLRTETIDGGTHAADAARVYRLGMGWLLADRKAEATKR